MNTLPTLGQLIEFESIRKFLYERADQLVSNHYACEVDSLHIENGYVHVGYDTMCMGCRDRDGDSIPLQAFLVDLNEARGIVNREREANRQAEILRQEQSKLEDIKRQEINDRATYDRLKKKFEPITKDEMKAAIANMENEGGHDPKVPTIFPVED